MTIEPDSRPQNRKPVALWAGVAAIVVVLLFLGWSLFLKQQTLAQWAESNRRPGWVLLDQQENRFGRIAVYNAGDHRLAIIHHWSGGQRRSDTSVILGEGETDVTDETRQYESLVRYRYFGLWKEPSGWIQPIQRDYQGDIQLKIFLEREESRREGSPPVFELKDPSGPPAFEMQLKWPADDSTQ